MKKLKELLNFFNWALLFQHMTKNPYCAAFPQEMPEPRPQ